jgi:hypothetical protein
VSTGPSSLARVRPLLTDLEPAAQRTALLLCYYYTVPRDRDFLKEIKEERRRLVRTSGALHMLSSRLANTKKNVEAILDDSIESLAETVRTAHTRSWDSALLPIPGELSLVQQFRRKGLPDPAQYLEKFITSWLEVEVFAAREVEFLRGQIQPTRSLSRKYPRQYWQQGRMEYTLRQLFEHFSASGNMLVRDIEERIGKILHELDGGTRSVESRGGCPSVREAIRRVKNDAQRRLECEEFIKSRLHPLTS